MKTLFSTALINTSYGSWRQLLKFYSVKSRLGWFILTMVPSTRIRNIFESATLSFQGREIFPSTRSVFKSNSPVTYPMVFGFTSCSQGSWRVDLKISGFAAEFADCVWTEAVSENKQLWLKNIRILSLWSR